MGGAEGSALGTVVDGAGDGRSAFATLTVTPVRSSPFVTAGTPSRPAHSLPPSTTPALATYVSVGSITPGSTAIENAIGDPVGRRDDLAGDHRPGRRVDERGDRDGVTRSSVAFGDRDRAGHGAGVGRWLAVATRATPLVGPPVMTGTGSKVWYTVEPSMIDPNSA